MLPYHDLFTITDVEALARLGDALALEGIPCSLAFGEGRGEVRCTIIVIFNASQQLNTNHLICLVESNLALA